MDDNDNVPGFTANDIPGLEEKLSGLGDDLQPSDKLVEDKKDEPAESEEKSEEIEEDKKPTEENKSTEESEEGSETSDESGDGYTIDDEEDKSEEQESDAPTEAAEQSQLTAEQQYILKGISPITVKGTVGDDKVQEFKVYSPEQLPQGFKYVDDRESATANKNFSLLENQAEKLQNDFRTQENTKSAKAFKEAEDTADRADIGRLQRDGELPRFKIDSNDPKFAEDPAAVLIQEVLDFKDEKNQQYLKESQAGRPFRHIGFEEALLMYQRSKPAKVDTAQDKEDKEREALAKRTSGTTGTKYTDESKPRVHSGMGSMDLDALIESKTQGW